MKITLLLASFILQCTYVFSQTKNEYFSFLEKHFENTALPDSIHCRDLISAINPGYAFLSYLNTYPYYSNASNQLSKNQFDYLFQSVDSLYRHNIWSLDACCPNTKEAFYSAFLIYPVAVFAVSENYAAFILSFVDDDGIEKVLYTVDQNAVIIDKLPLAFYHRHGSYTEDDGSKGIWWTTKNAIIFKDLSVKIDAGAHKNFQIKANGVIERKN